jgi:thioredoxin 1
MEPVLDKLKEVVKIIKVDAEHSADTANHYKIRAVPTIIFFKDGKEESRLEGLQKEDIILGRLAELK